MQWEQQYPRHVLAKTNTPCTYAGSLRLYTSWVLHSIAVMAVSSGGELCTRTMCLSSWLMFSALPSSLTCTSQHGNDQNMCKMKKHTMCVTFLKLQWLTTKLSKPPGTFACTDQFLAKQKATTNFCATTMLKVWCWYFALSSFRVAAVFINGALEWAGQKRRLTIDNQYYVIEVALMLLVATNVSLLR